MHIKYIEVSNFRKLLSVRIDISDSTTLFVGANNSGKTSAMLALRKFLSPKSQPFELNDFTLCHWSAINQIGQEWIEARDRGMPIALEIFDWANFLPAVDLWLSVENNEIHHIRSLIPTLDWEGGDIGVRLRFEPKELPNLYRDFLEAFDRAQTMILATNEGKTQKGKKAKEPGEGDNKLTIWPSNLIDFLERRLSHYFAIRPYSLDPKLVKEPEDSMARPQTLPEDIVPIGGDPLAGLIRVNDIPAQRGFGESLPSDGEEDGSVRPKLGRLSNQLRSYYNKHLDPTNHPDPNDLEALQAIEAAQNAFNSRLTESFKAAFAEVEGMGYPGVTDPRPRVSTRLRAIDGLNHSAAVSFEVDVIHDGKSSTPLLRLPEDNNGLGYQNLISMIFKLMSFRDGWMRVGKASRNSQAAHIEPLHLVLVEEPEAHLHAQVQQVFINKAYKVLRAHEDLGKSKKLRTQLIVSTHSSHVAHEIPFSCLRYFRRLPAGMPAHVPVSTVINLSKVFGTENETERFVTRYLRAHHADLFFADATILVEGPAEKMLLPNFIRSGHEFLTQCYLTILEIGGSHAHKLKDLIDELGLLTLIITDIDSLEKPGGSSAPPLLKKGQVTNNSTLKTWLPKLENIDDLLSAEDKKKVSKGDHLFEVRVSYQIPIKITIPGSKAEELAYPYTFEDSFVFENLEFFSKLNGNGLIKKFREAISAEETAASLSQRIWKDLRTGKKAEFALEIIDAKSFNSLIVPKYIQDGLQWLEVQLKKKQVEILSMVPESEND